MIFTWSCSSGCISLSVVTFRFTQVLFVRFGGCESRFNSFLDLAHNFAVVYNMLTALSVHLGDVIMLTCLCLAGIMFTTVILACLLISKGMGITLVLQEVYLKDLLVYILSLAAVNHLPLNHMLSDHRYILSNMHLCVCCAM